jgi:hypothetical protein
MTMNLTDALSPRAMFELLCAFSMWRRNIRVQVDRNLYEEDGSRVREAGFIAAADNGGEDVGHVSTTPIRFRRRAAR